MSNNLQISIIVPVFNVEQYLEECIESVIALDIDDAEFILIDDGSTDGSNQILRKYKPIDPRIKLIEQKNEGNGAARNAGLKIARGEYILFLDSDDILYPESIKMALDNAKVNSSDIVVCDYFEFEKLSKAKYRYDRAYLPEGVIKDHKMIMSKILYFDISYSVWNKIYNSSFLENNSLSFKTGVWFEDLEFIFRAFFHAQVISKENSVLVGYRQRAGSIMKSVSEKVLDKKTIVYELMAFLEDQEELSLFADGFKFMFFKMYISIIYQVLKNKGVLSKKRDIIKHIFSDPFFYNEILSNSMVYEQINLSEKLLFLQLKYKILGLRSFPIYNALLKMERK